MRKIESEKTVMIKVIKVQLSSHVPRIFQPCSQHDVIELRIRCFLV